MKFRYTYRTRDNVVHEGEIAAPSREAAFTELKGQGIRPSRMEESPGVFNKLFGKGKRWIAIVGLSLVAVVLAVAFSRMSSRLTVLQSSQERAPRHQIYGDPSVMSDLFDGNYAQAFDNLGERFIARYAQPGEERVLEDTPNPGDGEIASALTNRIKFVEGELREIRELKQIVNGMKDELREYLANGGSYKGYRVALVKRQVEESRIRKRVEQELKNEPNSQVWREKNARLRELGIAAIAKDENF